MSTHSFRFRVGLSLLLGLIWSDAALGDCPLFAPAMHYGAGDAPQSVAIGDLDGDHVSDLVVANLRSDNVSVLLGVGDGTFAPSVQYAAGNGPYSVAIGDLDGDRVPDLAVANFYSDVSVLLGVGDGTFAAAVHYGAGSRPASVAIGDLDGDLAPDLAVANFAGDNVSVLLGFGDGTFAAAVHYSTGRGPASVAIRDLDGDQAPDLVMANVGNNSVSVLLGVGDGTFAAAVHYATGGLPVSVEISDLDGDQVPDLVVANYRSDDVSVLLAVGDGTFAAAVHYGAGDAPQSVAIGDLDGDQVPDLAVANYYSDNVSVLLGFGDGTFAASVLYAAGSRPASVAIGDLDGDLAPDLAVANSAGDNVSVLLNQSELLGDLNCDGRFNGADIDPFFLALVDPPAYLAQFPNCNRLNGDLNCDRQLNRADIDGFFNCLAGNCADCNANGIPDYCEALDPLAIKTQPQDTTACVGNSATLTVETNRAFSYQWRKNGNPIAGATSRRLRFSPVQLSDAGDYDVIVGDACVSLTSDIATLTVHTAPAINMHPRSQTVCLGGPLVLSVDATGPALTYQWRKDGTDIPGATDPTYAVPAVLQSDGGVYDVTVANSCDTVRSDPASVTIQTTILTHPAGQTVCENDPVFFTVGATGAALTYQWRKDGVNINGATLNFFVINAAVMSDAGIYDVVVTSAQCMQTSDPAPLVVQQCP